MEVIFSCEPRFVEDRPAENRRQGTRQRLNRRRLDIHLTLVLAAKRGIDSYRWRIALLGLF